MNRMKGMDVCALSGSKSLRLKTMHVFFSIINSAFFMALLTVTATEGGMSREKNKQIGT